MNFEPRPEENALVEAARSLAPSIVACRDEIESARRLPTPLVESMEEAGIFRMYVPVEIGGLDVRPGALIETVMAVSAADGSTGWNAMICGVQGLYLSRLAEGDARRILASGGHGIAGSLSPSGSAARVDGGYQLRGRWGFASGSDQATWMMAPAVILEDGAPLKAPGGAPIWRVMLLPKEQCSLLDTWHTSGMRGTGSHDFTVDDALIPENFTLDPSSPGRYGGPLHRLPILTAFGPGVASVCLGIARGAIDELIRLAREKRPLLSSGSLRERVAVQLQVAEAEALVLSAHAFLHQAVGEVFAAAEAGRPPSLKERTNQRLAAWNSARSGLRATELAFSAAGTTSIYTSSPLDRAMRDVRVAAQHVVAGAAAHEAAGKALLGLEAGPLV